MKKRIKRYKIFDLSKKRNYKEAFLFYLFYLLITVLSAAFIGAIVGILLSKDEFSQRQIGINMGLWISVIISLSLSFSMIQQKNYEDNVKIVVISLISGPLAYFGGAVFGLLPLLYLSTLKINK